MVNGRINLKQLLFSSVKIKIASKINFIRAKSCRFAAKEDKLRFLEKEACDLT